jgi:hypothetical protein
VTFSFLLSCASLLFKAVTGMRCEVSFVAGAETLECIFGRGVDFGDFNDFAEAILSAGDLECREDKLLLLECRPVSMKGNRSFICGDLGVPNTDWEADALL